MSVTTAGPKRVGAGAEILGPAHRDGLVGDALVTRDDRETVAADGLADADRTVCERDRRADAQARALIGVGLAAAARTEVAVETAGV